ncbi:phenylalanine--tRNA ligase subunit beta [Pediococcus claussenii]|uniref:Phenylalanine--tRNA ligase beta subunit n=1 Tax=Pediococcus claussenii (strain ATCC BAA-344 / DSM 14800 / JCM 18046 / KCTC 3811 / LMG 21948 / P06) TaxID=701521 RepID=G8PDN8_PEDCP|nr:phenylalanine--tRNA ligase subunit beta [Pediococcus claussenii]AEV95373.1 phenylalanine--tRNA ligase, beta subunit [Pediococcus claussenii ATCC BAA-344]ANZ68904.1 phenylalanine--tRNA ligase subunit beta [Pediococcus claussenii]ANZ70720.1 phenylalanine--tRNA ligase subunit beta [Pediococcus claussenii]KRN19016.1 pheT protein [Pediococcus claussenii]
MKLSYKWLSEYLELNIAPKDLAEKIERTAVEVDSVRRLDDKLKKIVVGHTLEVVDHPDSDHLHIVQVEVGEEEPIQIVCGAPNIAADQDVIVALHGSRIKDNVKIKRSKMRGVPSNGMICALQEIGFDDSVVPKEFVDGIYVFPADSEVKPGDSVMEALGMDDDIIDTSVTPNRGDMFSMNGNVHEIAAILDQKATFEERKVEETGNSANAEISVDVVNPEFAPVYKMRVVNEVKVTSSPFWLQVKLMKAGVRPINNVVDVTNYIMLKYGQPLHAFDQTTLGTDISVDAAGPNVTFTTLDGVERKLRPDDLVIKSSDTPIALAGVMGGMDSEISNQTTDVVLEAAIFDPIMIRKTARYHVLHSEAAMRFERGIDYSSLQTALDEASEMIREIAGGFVMSDTVIGNDTKINLTEVNVKLSRINKILGTNLERSEVEHIFDRLGFESVFSNDQFTITIPLRRWDIAIEADILEEVARIYGYDNLPSTLPSSGSTVGRLSANQRLMRETRNVLEGLGLTQAMSYGLTTLEKAQRFTQAESDKLVKVDWPMTKDHEALRMSLISGLLDDVAYNQARSVSNVALYEQGRIFEKTTDDVQPMETEHLAGVIAGSLMSKAWNTKNQDVDFYQVKGIVDQYLHNLGLTGNITYRANHDLNSLHPGRTADVLVNDEVIGFIGQVHPELAKQLKISETYVFELDFTKIMELPKNIQHYDAVSKYPVITRDVAMLVDNDISNQSILDVMNSTKQKYLVDIKLFDVYAGNHLPSGKRSMAYQLTYQDQNETLQESVVNNEFDELQMALQTQLNATIR